MAGGLRGPPASLRLLRAGLHGAGFRNALAAAVDVAAQAPNKMEGLNEAIASMSRIIVMCMRRGPGVASTASGVAAFAVRYRPAV